MKYEKYNQRHIYLIEYTQSIINKFLIGWEGYNNLELMLISDPFSCLWDTFSILTHSPTDDFKHTSIIEMLMKLKKILDGDQWSCTCNVVRDLVLCLLCELWSCAGAKLCHVQLSSASDQLHAAGTSTPATPATPAFHLELSNTLPSPLHNYSSTNTV